MWHQHSQNAIVSADSAVNSYLSYIVSECRARSPETHSDGIIHSIISDHGLAFHS